MTSIWFWWEALDIYCSHVCNGFPITLLVAFKIFSSLVFNSFNYDVLGVMGFFYIVIPLEVHWAYWVVYWVLPNLETFGLYSFFCSIFSLLLRIQLYMCWTAWYCPTWDWDFFFPSLFFLYSLDKIISIRHQHSAVMPNHLDFVSISLLRVPSLVIYYKFEHTSKSYFKILVC